MQRLLVGILILLFGGIIGCQSRSSKALNEFRQLNETNVAKVRTCFVIFSSRNGGRSPKDQTELVEFLKSGQVDRNLERLGVDKSDLDNIFTSERDGNPLKIRWGIEMGLNVDAPVAFETVGVDGVRLVAADVVIEVSSEEQYEALWNGDYSPKSSTQNSR